LNIKLTQRSHWDSLQCYPSAWSEWCVFRSLSTQNFNYAQNIVTPNVSWWTSRKKHYATLTVTQDFLYILIHDQMNNETKVMGMCGREELEKHGRVEEKVMNFIQETRFD